MENKRPGCQKLFGWQEPREAIAICKQPLDSLPFSINGVRIV
jgi:hypothetical protein